MLAADGSFSFAGVPEEAVTLYTRIPAYRLATIATFQQIQDSQVGMFVDADKSGLELYFQPEAANKRPRDNFFGRTTRGLDDIDRRRAVTFDCLLPTKQSGR